MSGIMMQLLGAAGGGANYFISVIETAVDADERNCMHGVVDSSDNIYVDFDYQESSTRYMGLVKYNSAGDVLAQRRLTNATYRSAEPDNPYGQSSSWPSIIDSSDNYRIAAKATQSNNNPVFLNINTSNLTITSKYEKEFSSGSEYGTFYDSSGNFYLCGSTGYSGVGQVAKFNSSGSEQWAKTMNQTDGGGTGFFLCGGGTDSSGNVYVVGSQPRSEYRGSISKFNSSGTNQWTRWLYEGGQSNSFFQVKCDSSGNPYVVGNMGASGGKNLAYVAKLNPSNGDVTWDYVHCKVGDEQGGGFQSIDFDSSGNVYVAGIVREDKYPNGAFFGSYRNFGVYVKLNSSGTVQWQRGLGHTTGSSAQNGSRAFATIAIDSNDDMILTTAQSDSSADGQGTRFYVARLPNDGSLTGSYGTVSAKYGATDLGDKNIGAAGTPTHGNSSTSTTNITSNIADGSNTYTINTQVA
tara:strand:- start:4021 stop:5418 length:1398 start_codon:yes stop_codon:yes gene_type:complete